MEFIWLLALLLPIALPAIAFLLTRRVGFWWRSAAILVVNLVSFPVAAFSVVVARHPEILNADHVNPGVGVSGAPALLVWFPSFLVILAAILCLAVGRSLDKSPAE